MAKRSTSKSASAKLTGAEPIVVLCGAETFGQELRLAELRAAVKARSDAEPDTIRFDGKNASLADVLDEVRSYSLMSKPKIVVVDDADPFITAHRERLERYADHPTDIATLVLRAGTWNARWRLHKAVEACGRVIKCEPLAADQAERWAGDYAEQRYGVKLERRAAVLLVEHLGTDMGRLAAEIGKLAASTPRGRAVDADQVEALVGLASDEKAWEIQSALLSGSPAAAVAKARELVDLASVPEQVVGYFVADLLRKLQQAAVMLARGDREFDVMKELKVWGDRQRPFSAAVRRLGPVGTADLLDRYVRVDARSKSGYGPLRQGIETFCITFTTALRPAR